MNPERVFVDTNLFLRYLTNDIPEQADAVEELLRQAVDGKVMLVTSSLVIAEIVWVLESFYQQRREQIKQHILAILNTPGLEVAETEMLLAGIVWYAEKNVDFIDACNAVWALLHGVETVCTFDRRHFARLEGITVRGPAEVVV